MDEINVEIIVLGGIVLVIGTFLLIPSAKESFMALIQ